MIAVKNQTHQISEAFMLGHTHSFITPYEITLVDLQPDPISTEEPKYVGTINISQSEKK